MLQIVDPFRGVDLFSVLIKLVLAVVLGSAIGMERSYKNRPAGVRTHMLVSSGAAIASMTGIYLYLVAGVPTDITRISASVVSGLSFLGVGTIIVTKNYSVKGLTTAAGLWVSGIIGLCIGAGFYEGAIVSTALVLFTEGILSKIKNNMTHDLQFTVEILTKRKEALDEVMRSFKRNHGSITNLRIIAANDEEEQNYYLAFLSVRASANANKQKMLEEAMAVDGVVEFTELEELDES